MQTNFGLNLHKILLAETQQLFYQIMLLKMYYRFFYVKFRIFKEKILMEELNVMLVFCGK